ncbi:hypothetical protein MNBD_ALPHA12-1196 [hydrothermal vent metagenome]|uniref:Uncharacterized protein n=1 Tax=hydrothermal vent metagenome TaxID=652676 RepID=A0A3B0U887_9ZZZZ
MNEILAWITGLVALLLPGFGVTPAPQYNGYIEANYVYVAPASPGRIAAINVTEGTQIAKGTLLFSLEKDQYLASLRAAKARQSVAAANLVNMETGSRDQEVAVIRATLEKAMADQNLASVNFERTKQLDAQGLVPTAKLDADQARLTSANAQVAQLKAQLAVAELPARDAQLVAARASLDAARAEVDAAKIALANRTIAAPAGGLVERVFFRAGEVASTGSPVVVLLPPGQLKARFFIPEADRMAFKLGDRLALSCDGCPDNLEASLSYMSSDPQYTPPIIYSQDQRERMVFMAEARIEDGAGLLPGQPITMKVLP